METVLSSLTKFLTHHRDLAPDLIDRWSPHLETQVNVITTKGSPVDGRAGVYTDGEFTWHHIRVPKFADSEPSFTDYKLSFPLDLYCEAIGSTGWDWKNLRSRWVGFDFDDLTDHAAGIGIDDEALAEVRAKATALPYVEVRRSTGGRGLHLYVHVDVECENHTVHAALARSVLGMMSADTGFDFASRIDCCGGNMWIWRRNLLEPDSLGLKLIKAAERNCVPPANWRDHIDVVTRKRSKTHVQGNGEVESLARARKSIQLDETHKAHIEALSATGYYTFWNDDHHLLQTKTKALAEIYEAGGVKGIFSTLSEGNNPHEPNCFLFPLEDGAWKVCRFSKGVAETDTWHQDGTGYTTCFFNRLPTLQAACLHFGGMKDKNGEFVFQSRDDAEKTLRSLGDSYSIPATDKEIRLGQIKDGSITVSIAKDKDDPAPAGFINKKSHSFRILRTVIEQAKETEHEYDDVLRRLVTVAGENAGWVIRDENGRWLDFPKDDARDTLVSLGVDKTEISAILGHLIQRPWTLVNLPFQPEYPGGRQWNYKAAQFAVQPVAGEYPTWNLVLEHCGKSLDSYVKDLDWCKEEGIHSGADYLKMWIACLLRQPFEPLPYLFMFGDEDCGKSIFHEAISKLMTSGVVKADTALANRSDFNGELANAVLCVVEERDISKSPGAHARMKEWVTGRTISIRRMRTDSYSQLNTTHWIQCSNHISMCPVFNGDTRIVVLWVDKPQNPIAKPVLEARILDEAPAFLQSLLELELPKHRSRLRLPIVETNHKRMAQSLSSTSLERFIAEKIAPAHGAYIKLKEFVDKLHVWLPPHDVDEWPSHKVTRSLPDMHKTQPRGKGGRAHVSNAKWRDAGIVSKA